MRKQRDEQGVDRRHLLRGLSAGAVAAAATLPAGGRPAVAAESEDERTKARYQPDAQDVQAYYRTNRY